MTVPTRPTSRLRLTQADFEKHLEEQIEFLKLSAAAFDGGFESEAKRLAVTLRVMLHDTPDSQSLLTHLCRKNIDFWNTSLPRPKETAGFSGLTLMELGTGSKEFFAGLDDTPFHAWVSFDEWWHAPVLIDVNGLEMTRKDLVLLTANQDGGAHIDSSLDRRFASLSRQNGLNWTIGKMGPGNVLLGPSVPMGDPTRPSIRQITHEVLKTLIPGYVMNPRKRAGIVVTTSLALNATISAVPRIPVVGRNAQCPCGSGKKYKQCHGAAA
jgi:hypothetical protein